MFDWMKKTVPHKKDSEYKMIANFYKWVPLLKELVKKDIVLKYRKAHLGILWILIEPLLSSMVYCIIFYRLYNMEDKSFLLYTLIGRLLYTIFRNSTSAAGNSIVKNQNLLRKYYLPKSLMPLCAVISQFVFGLISLLDLFPIALIVGIRPSLKWVEVLIPLVIVFLLSLSIGYILSVIETFIRDVSYLWNTMLTFIMYASAIFYLPEKIVRNGYQWVFDYNPLYKIIESARMVLLYQSNVDLGALSYPFIFSVISLFIGIGLFYKMNKYFVYYL